MNLNDCPIAVKGYTAMPLETVRRVKRVVLPYNFRPFHQDSIQDPILREAQIIGWSFNPSNLSWVIFIEHESFEPLIKGCEVEKMELVIEPKLSKHGAALRAMLNQG